LKFGKRTFTAAVWIGLQLSGSMTTARLSSYDSVFSELFAPFRGYSSFRFTFAPLRLCVRFLSSTYQSPITFHLSLLAFLLANEGGSSLLEKLGPDVALSFGTSGTDVSRTFNEEPIQRFSATSQHVLYADIQEI
jgi:hypothetical protein